MVYLTGFTDEVAADPDRQIEVCRSLGWELIDLRTVGTYNVVTLPEDDFDGLLEKLDRFGIRISSFGSRIANWSRTLRDSLDQDVEELNQAIPRMKRAGTPFIRVMSYRPPDGPEADAPEVRREVIRRLTLLTRIAEEADIVLLHENCETWGGRSVDHTTSLLEAIPSSAFQLAFDTGNPPASVDMRFGSGDGADPADTSIPPRRCQDGLEFYDAVRERVAYVHIKDAVAEAPCRNVSYTWPGEGNGRIREILSALKRDGFNGPISIEPHMAVVYHDPSVSAGDEARREIFKEYADRTKMLLEEAGLL